MFFLLFEHKDVILHLVEVKDIVVKHQCGIFVDAVALGPRVRLLVVELFHLGAILALAEGIVIFLKGVTVVEIAVCLHTHGGVVALERLQQFGIVINRFRILNHFFYMLEIHLVHFGRLRHAHDGAHSGQQQRYDEFCSHFSVS